MKGKQQKSKTVTPTIKSDAEQQGLYFWLMKLYPIILILTCLATFLPIFNNQFILWDDPSYITKNPFIKNINFSNIIYIFTHPIANNYHPLTMLSLSLNYQFSQLHPLAYFGTNLSLHVLNAFLVYFFIFKLSNKNKAVSVFCSLIFAIHPMHVESVAWASERKDVLYSFFFLGGLISWLYYLENKDKKTYIITFILALCSLLSKPAAIIFPVALITIEYYKNNRFDFKLIINKIPFIIISAIGLYITILAQKQNNMIVGDFTRHTPIDRLLYASYGFVIYLIKFFIPFQLSSFHPFPNSPGIMVYLSPILILALMVAIYFSKTNKRLLVFGGLFFLVNLLLVLQFISIGDAVYAERYTYVPYIGLSFVFGMYLFKPELKINPRLLWSIVLMYCGSLAIAANTRAKVWHDGETLWTDMIEKYPDNEMGYFARGNFYAEKKQREKAIADYSEAIKLGTDFNTYNNRGKVYSEMNRYEDALLDFNTTLKLNPGIENGYLRRAQVLLALNKPEEALKDVNLEIENNPTYEAYLLRGAIFTSLLKYEEAIADYTKASSIGDGVAALSYRGNIYVKQKNFSAALSDFSQVLNQYPNDTTVLAIRAGIFCQTNDFEKAISDYSLLLSINPNDARTLSNRGAAYFQLKEYNKAIDDILKATAIEPGNARNFSNLAFIYEKAGNKEKALFFAKKAMQMGCGFPPDFMARIQN